MSTRLRILLFMSLAATVAFIGCGENNPSEPSLEQSFAGEPIGSLEAVPTDRDLEFRDQLTPGAFTICKVADGATIKFPFETLAEGPGVDRANLYRPYVELGDGECTDVYRAPSGPDMAPDTVTIMELVPEGWQVDRVAIWNIAGDVDSGYEVTFHEYGAGTNIISGQIDANKIGCVAIFYNSEIPEEGECTRSPGYFMTHPDAWPVEMITVGGVEYTKDEAIDLMWLPVAGDKTKTIFASLVAAMLNEARGTNTSCLGDVIDNANSWFEDYPMCSNVRGNSAAWTAGSPMHALMDDYNNGRLDCAEHCEDGDGDNVPAAPRTGRMRNN